MSSLLEPADWTFPIPIAFGPGRIQDLGTLCNRAGMSAPLIVTDRNSSGLPFIGQAVDILRSAGLRADVFAGISPNPTVADVTEGGEAFRRGGFDGVVALGGGSGMDGGKAVAISARNDVPLVEFDNDLDSSPAVGSEGLVPLICVPTTAGTGAETESTAMVTDTDRGIKICVWHEDLHPAVAILDPELTVGLPDNLTAWTGVDALVHAIEAYSVNAFHPLCDGAAIEAIRLIWEWLPKAFENGANLEARAGMLTGSCLGGVSFNKGLGLVHAMSHMVGAVYDTHHGLTNAVLLSPVLEFNRDVLGDKTRIMAEAMGLDDTSHDGFVGAIDDLLASLGIPTQLRAIGVGNDRLHELAEKSLGDAAVGTNPRTSTVADIETLLTARL